MTLSVFPAPDDIPPSPRLNSEPARVYASLFRPKKWPRRSFRRWSCLRWIIRISGKRSRTLRAHH